MSKRYPAVLLGTALSALLGAAEASQGAISYTYEYQVGHTATAGADPDVVLNDGVIATENRPWTLSEPTATLYRLDDDSAPQPGINLTLDDTYDLGSLTIHYINDENAAVSAPETLLITVDGQLLPLFFDFDHGYAAEPDTSIAKSVTVDLTGYSGSAITLDFRNSLPEGEWQGTPFYGQWTALSEIVVNEVPEPASLALLGVGAVMVLRRRRG